MSKYLEVKYALAKDVTEFIATKVAQPPDYLLALQVYLIFFLQVP
jgi:hypothetical protein